MLREGICLTGRNVRETEGALNNTASLHLKIGDRGKNTIVCIMGNGSKCYRQNLSFLR